MAARGGADEEGLSQKAAPAFLDFSRQKITTKEELKSAVWKIPDLRMRPDRLWDDEVLCTFKAVDYPFCDPVPLDLRTVRIRDLSQVDIDWKMLTLLRPGTRLEEDVFSRFVQLDRLKLKTSLHEAASGLRPTFVAKTTRGVSKMATTRPVVRPSSPKDRKAEEESTDDTSSLSQDLMNYECFAREPLDDNDTGDLSGGVHAIGGTESGTSGQSSKKQEGARTRGRPGVQQKQQERSKSKAHHRQKGSAEEKEKKNKADQPLPEQKEISKHKSKTRQQQQKKKKTKTPKEDRK